MDILNIDSPTLSCAMTDCRHAVEPGAPPHLARLCTCCRAALAPQPAELERARVASLFTHEPKTWGIIEISPGMAMSLLEHDACGRRVELARIERYAADMGAGRWELNPDPVLLGRDGGLYNGLLRLYAIVRAQLRVPLFVASGLDPTAYDTIDRGLPRRLHRATSAAATLPLR